MVFVGERALSAKGKEKGGLQLLCSYYCGYLTALCSRHVHFLTSSSTFSTFSRVWKGHPRFVSAMVERFPALSPVAVTAFEWLCSGVLPEVSGELVASCKAPLAALPWTPVGLLTCRRRRKKKESKNINIYIEVRSLRYFTGFTSKIQSRVYKHDSNSSNKPFPSFQSCLLAS